MRLLPTTCQHNIASDAVRDAHLHLPPSLGGKESSSPVVFDDPVPGIVNIRYGICASILKKRTRIDGEMLSKVTSKTLLLLVRPPVYEQPPLHIRSKDGEFVMRETENVKKGLLRAPQGALVMETGAA